MGILDSINQGLGNIDPQMAMMMGSNILAAQHQPTPYKQSTMGRFAQGMQQSMPMMMQMQSMKQQAAEKKTALDEKKLRIEQNRKSATNLYTTLQKQFSSQRSEGGIDVTPNEQLMLQKAEYGMQNPESFNQASFGGYSDMLKPQDEGKGFPGRSQFTATANQWVSSLPPEQQEAARNYIATQSLDLPRTMTDATGNTVTLPGLNTGGFVPPGQQPELPAPSQQTLPPPTALGAPAQKATNTFARLNKSYVNYKNRLKELGPRFLKTGGKLRLESSYRDLLLEMKELYNLGVLNGPDLMIMESILQNPTDFFLNAAEKVGLLTVEDMIQAMDETIGNKINAAVDVSNEMYGTSLKPVKLSGQQEIAPDGVQSVGSEAEAEDLPPGTRFRLPDGRTGTVR